MDHLLSDEKWLSPGQVNELIRRTGLQTRAGKSFLVIEVVTDELAKYRQGHLPGAINLDTNRIERGPMWNIVPYNELEQALLAHGITYEMTVLLYSRIPFAVARTALALMSTGVRDVRLLAGGIEAWIASGYALETAPNPPTPAEVFGQAIPAHPEYIISMEQVRTLLRDGNAILACVRSWEEYMGETSGYDYIQPKGRIPGSVWAGHPMLSAHLQEKNPGLDLTARRIQELAAAWRERGITPDKKVVFYCGTGWRASLAFFYAFSIGWKDICIYDGGWLEWSAQPDNPIETGEPH